MRSIKEIEEEIEQRTEIIEFASVVAMIAFSISVGEIVSAVTDKSTSSFWWGLTAMCCSATLCLVSIVVYEYSLRRVLKKHVEGVAKEKELADYRQTEHARAIEIFDAETRLAKAKSGSK